MDLKSKPGDTRFRVRLPIKGPQEKAAEEKAAEEKAAEEKAAEEKSPN
jgi:hypothetical protein